MALSERMIKSALPRDKRYKMYDAEGLYLEVAPSGGKWWRFRFMFDGKENRVSLGTWPAVNLKDARAHRDAMERLLERGVNPSKQRHQRRGRPGDNDEESFEAVAREWFARFRHTWSDGYAGRMFSRLERDIFPWLGKQRIGSIGPAQLLQALRRIEDRGALESAHRTKEHCGQVFRYAVATQRAERDITVDLRGALPPAKEKHFAAVTEPAEVGRLLRVVTNYSGSYITVCALRLAPLVFVRPGELRKARWADIDFDEGLWRFQLTKKDAPHIVPLSRQAVAILKDLQPLTGGGIYVFPSERGPDRPMSDNTVLGALRRMGIGKDEMTGHGFRAMARTILDEVLEFRPELIEHQLAHVVRDPLGRAYNRTTHLPQRREMMQRWADYLDELQSGQEKTTQDSR